MPEPRHPSVDRVLEALPDQREALEQVLRSTLAAEVVAAEIRAEGFPMSASTIRSYRRSLRRAEESPA